MTLVGLRIVGEDFADGLKQGYKMAIAEIISDLNERKNRFDRLGETSITYLYSNLIETYEAKAKELD